MVFPFHAPPFWLFLQIVVVVTEIYPRIRTGRDCSIPDRVLTIQFHLLEICGQVFPSDSFHPLDCRADCECYRIGFDGEGIDLLQRCIGFR